MGEFAEIMRSYLANRTVIVVICSALIIWNCKTRFFYMQAIIRMLPRHGRDLMLVRGAELRRRFLF